MVIKVFALTPGTAAGFQLEAVFQFPELPEAQMDWASVFSNPRKQNKKAKNRGAAIRRCVITGDSVW